LEQSLLYVENYMDMLNPLNKAIQTINDELILSKPEI